MTLDELNSVDVNDPGAVKALQEFLRSRGYYSKRIDGKWEGGTIDAVKAYRADLQTESANRRATAEAGAQTEAAKNSPVRMAKEAGPYVVGGAGGLLTGALMARKGRNQDEALATETRSALANKRNAPAITEQTMDRRLGQRRWRSGQLALTGAAGLAAAELTRRYIKPQMDEEARPYVDMAANAEQGFGAAASTMAMKNLAGDVFGKSPIPADVETEIRSRAAEARGDPHTISNRNAATAASEADTAREARMAGLRARTAADLRTEARAAGLHVSGTKEDLVRRLAEGAANSNEPARSKISDYVRQRLTSEAGKTATVDEVYDDYVRQVRGAGGEPLPQKAFMREMASEGIQMGRIAGKNRFLTALKDAPKSSLLLPFAAGAVAYDAASSDAEAAGEDVATQRGRGAVAGGAAAGTVYGASKLAPYAIDAVRKSPLGRAALRAVPVAGAALTAYDIGSYMAEGARPAPKNDAFAEQYARTHPRHDPQAMVAERARARQAVRAERQAETFDADLQAFFDAVDEYNGGLSDQGYGP